MGADESQSLIPGSRSRRKKDEDNGCCGSPSTGILVNRILILILLVPFVAASLYYQGQLTAVSGTVHELEKEVADHATVIQRFNESVTNSDVLNRMKLLEDTLNKTTRDLEHNMLQLQQKVDHQLQDTLTELGDTVQEAKDAISQQVELVKKDVEQYVITTQDQFSMENSFMIYQLAGTLTLLSCLISMWHMTAHVRKMQEPVVQRKILAILWMSPIYAVTSWFSLVFPAAEGYLAIVKDGYEAYIIYQFLSFCIAVLGKGDRNKVVDILAKRADHLTPPFRLCWCCDKGDPYENNPRALADAILLQCQVFGMQFVFLRPLTTILNVTLAKLEYYGGADNPHDYRAPQFYISIIQNLSVFTAFAGLLKFYHAVDEDLQWCRPFAKFLCIKGVVFMTFWQGLAIVVLAETTDVGGGKSDEWAKSAQNFMICLEMLLFSIAHFYCFPTEEWNPDYRARVSRGLNETLAFGDFVQDLKLILKSGKKKKSKLRPSTVPEGDEADADDDQTARSSVVSSTPDLESAFRERLIDDDEEDDENIASAKERLKFLGLDRNESADSGDGEMAGSADEEGDQDDDQDSQFEEIEPPTETTGLLAATRNKDDSSSDEDEGVPPTKNEDVLKPSIFTTLGDLDGRSRSPYYK